VLQLGLRAVVLDVGEASGQVTASARAEMKSADAVQKARSILDGLRSLASLSDEPTHRALVDAVTVTSTGLTLEVAARLPVAEIAKVLQHAVIAATMMTDPRHRATRLHRGAAVRARDGSRVSARQIGPLAAPSPFAHRLADAADAEEVAQETFPAYTTRRYDPARPFATWLFAIGNVAANHAIARARRARDDRPAARWTPPRRATSRPPPVVDPASDVGSAPPRCCARRVPRPVAAYARAWPCADRQCAGPLVGRDQVMLFGRAVACSRGSLMRCWYTRAARQCPRPRRPGVAHDRGHAARCTSCQTFGRGLGSLDARSPPARTAARRSSLPRRWRLLTVTAPSRSASAVVLLAVNASRRSTGSLARRARIRGSGTAGSRASPPTVTRALANTRSRQSSIIADGSASTPCFAGGLR
jgi:hypothetical protein